jgi:hypothetical protein
MSPPPRSPDVAAREIERDKGELEQATSQAKKGARSWWSDTKGSIERQIAEMHTDIEQWQGACGSNG